MALQHLRSNTASKRPTPASMADGQLAINTNATSPGLFFKDAGGALIKVGPVHVGTSAPNSSPAGSSGNAIGEQWLDTSGGGYVLKIWDGSAWRSEAGEFVDAAGDTMTGALILPNGTAAAPALGVGSTDNGIYSPGADQVAISTNGTGRLFIDANGNVGVGAASPVSSTGYGGITMNGANGSILSMMQGGSETFRVTNATGYSYINTTGATPLLFGTGAGEHMRLDTSGRLGLGTSSPQDLLHVEGGSSPTIRLRTSTLGSNASPASTYIDFRGFNQEIRARIEAQDRRASVNGGFLNIGTAGSSNTLVNALHIDNSQRVGIGTESPGTSLQVGNGSGLQQASVSGGGYNLYLGASGGSIFGQASQAASVVFNTASVPLGIGTNAAQPLILGTSAQERARIDSSGRLLVGTSSTSATGTIFAQGSSSSTTGPSYLYLQRGQAAGASIGNGTSIGTINFTDNASGVFAQIAAEGDAPSSSGDYPGRLLFSTTADGASSPTERMRITSDAYIRLASGTGGIQFNGDTAAANALDDYEEGTVPSTNLVSTDFTASSGITTGGLYRKVGTLVFVTIFIRPVNFGEYPIGSTIQYTLPFAVSNSAIFVGSGYVGATTMSGTNYILSNVSLNSSTLTAYVKQESLSTITAKNIWISAVYTTS